MYHGSGIRVQRWTRVLLYILGKVKDGSSYNEEVLCTVYDYVGKADLELDFSFPVSLEIALKKKI